MISKFLISTTIINLMFFCGYWISHRGNLKHILSFSFMFSLCLLYFVFGAYFISPPPEINFNVVLLIIFVVYFFSLYSLFYVLFKCGLIGAIFHSLLMSAISFFHIIPPLTPLILYYDNNLFFLPKTASPLFNLFILYLIPAMFFCKTQVYGKTGIILLLVVMAIVFPHGHTQNRKNLKLAIIQVGLYLKQGGNISGFYKDLTVFLKKNSDIDIVAFSENNVFSEKETFNKKLTDGLIDVLNKNNFFEKHHFLIAINGYNGINNIITLYKHMNTELINQKKVLIPFIETSPFSKDSGMNSFYYFIDNKIKNRHININDELINTAICYESLFPLLFSEKHRLTIIQSNYNLLDRNKGYNRLLKIGSVLSKFSIGMQSDYVLNIQSYGGTILMDNKWTIDNDIFFKSKEHPFFVVRL